MSLFVFLSLEQRIRCKHAFRMLALFPKALESQDERFCNPTFQATMNGREVVREDGGTEASIMPCRKVRGLSGILRICTQPDCNASSCRLFHCGRLGFVPLLIDLDDTKGPSVTIRFPDLERMQDK
jgi:hypothetical protein